MPVVVKFGGSTFPAHAAYHDLAEELVRRVLSERRPLVVVVSAMQGETESLRGRLHEVDPRPRDSTVAGLLTTADLVSAHLLAAALHRRDCDATVLAGHQTGLVTDASFRWARVRHADPAPIRAALQEHPVVVVPGGQAVDGRGRPTWLGKNSSDLTALVVAAVLGSPVCEIHSDVDGVYTADPNLIRGTRPLPELTYDMAALMSLYGAKVLHRRAVQTARKHGTEIVCRLNRAPYPVGSTIGRSGASAAAVVVNRYSVVLRYDSDAAADRAHQVFHRVGLDTVRLPEGPMVVVVGGFADLDALQDRHGLAPGRPEGVPVTVIRGTQVTTHVAAGPEDARLLAQRLHDQLELPDPPLAPGGRLPAGV